MQTATKETTEREETEVLREGNSPSLQYVARIPCPCGAWQIHQSPAIVLKTASSGRCSPLLATHCKHTTTAIRRTVETNTVDLQMPLHLTIHIISGNSPYSTTFGILQMFTDALSYSTPLDSFDKSSSDVSLVKTIGSDRVQRFRV